MALKKINPISKVNDDTGFGTNANAYGGRFINRDGTFNLKREGASLWDRFNVYQVLISMPLWKFISLLLSFFIAINLFYTLLYFWVGADQFQGFVPQTTWGKFKELYFFSSETFTTVGYGRVNPVDDGRTSLLRLRL